MIRYVFLLILLGIWVILELCDLENRHLAAVSIWRLAMGLKATIDKARFIEEGIWKAQLEPEEAASLGECSSRQGPFSIILLESAMDYNEQSQTITFDPSTTKVLNIGSTDQVIIICLAAPQKKIAPQPQKAQPKPTITPPPKPPKPPKPVAPVKKPAPPQKPKPPKLAEYELSQPLATGDKLFLSELPPEMRELGEKLLSTVRSKFPGELCYEPRFAKFDETPEIFWTIKIQPYDKSLRITVRGTPDSFTEIQGVDLKVDKFGYSAFVITRKGQIPGALEAIRQGHRNMYE